MATHELHGSELANGVVAQIWIKRKYVQALWNSYQFDVRIDCCDLFAVEWCPGKLSA